MLDYSPLWDLMKKKNISQYYLLKYCGLDNKTLASMKKNGNITLLTVEKLCKALDCTPNDIVRFKDQHERTRFQCPFLMNKLWGVLRQKLRGEPPTAASSITLNFCSMFQKPPKPHKSLISRVFLWNKRFVPTPLFCSKSLLQL